MDFSAEEKYRLVLSIFTVQGVSRIRMAILAVGDPIARSINID